MNLVMEIEKSVIVVSCPVNMALPLDTFITCICGQNIGQNEIRSFNSLRVIVGMSSLVCVSRVSGGGS